MPAKHIVAAAEKIYESKECNEAFEKARELYPEYNDMGEDTDSALTYIMAAIQDQIEALPAADQDEVHEELNDMIYNGLT